MDVNQEPDHPQTQSALSRENHDRPLLRSPVVSALQPSRSYWAAASDVPPTGAKKREGKGGIRTTEGGCQNFRWSARMGAGGVDSSETRPGVQYS